MYPIVLRTMLLCVLMGFLAACTSSALNQGLAPKPVAATTQPAKIAPENPVGNEHALAPQLPSNPAVKAVSTQAPSQSSTKLAALDTTGKSFTFLPVSGAPQQAVSTLSKSLSASAEQAGLSLIPANQSGATYQVKGYFTALDDGSGTLLVYVWDILDASGKRLHRINGQERSSSKSSDPWQAVSQTQLNNVAGSTVASLNSWLASKS